MKERALRRPIQILIKLLFIIRLLFWPCRRCRAVVAGLRLSMTEQRCALF